MFGCVGRDCGGVCGGVGLFGGFLVAFWGGFGDFVGEKFCHIGKSYYFCNRK